MSCEQLTVRTTIQSRDAYVCACMKVTSADVVETVAAHNVRTVAELRRRTGAGGGCMACHRRLQCHLAAALELTPG